jgi:DNA mismatch endonuclease, patch repair protein
MTLPKSNSPRTDIYSPKKRSEIMSKIKGTNTKLEADFFRVLKKERISFTPHFKIIGKPDFVFKDKKIAFFIDSCFWHGCELHGSFPRSNQVFWKEKILRNTLRDTEVNRMLREKGWLSIRIWEHDIRKNLKRVLKRINQARAI